MTDKTKTNKPDLDMMDPEDLLAMVWRSTVKALITGLEAEGTEGKASVLSAASRFLADNRWSADSMKDPAKVLRQLTATGPLPFTTDDETGQDQPFN